MEFKLCLCTLSLLMVGRSHKILIVSAENSPSHKLESLTELSRDILRDEDELHYLSLLYPDNHEWEHGCLAAYFGAEISDQPGWFGDETNFDQTLMGNYHSHDKAELGSNETAATRYYDLIIMDKNSLPSKSRLHCWQHTPILLYIEDSIFSLPTEFMRITDAPCETLSELPSKNFTERFNTIKQLLKYLISLYKREGASRAKALINVLLRRGRLDAFQYSTRSHSYIEQYNIDVWCCILTIIAVLAGTAVYLVTIIILHILEKSRAGARIM